MDELGIKLRNIFKLLGIQNGGKTDHEEQEKELVVVVEELM